MILVDADLLWIDLAAANDTRFPTNRLALDTIRGRNLPAGITSQALLEVVGKRSYGTPVADIPKLPTDLLMQYGLTVVPDMVSVPYAGCSFDDVVQQMVTKMSLGDAVQAIQIRRYAANATVLLTWNAKHFVGKLPVPVMTPTDWLAGIGPLAAGS